MSFSGIALLASLGALGGFAAGLLGVGGGVVMFPLLYYVPPLFGLAPLDAKTVAAVVSSQVFFSALVGGWAHVRRGQVQSGLTVTAGIASAAGALIGAVASKWVSEGFLLVLFGLMTTAAGLTMFLPMPRRRGNELSAQNRPVAKLPLAAASLSGGIVTGFLGAGNFAFVPMLIYAFKVPTRVAIGSTLVIGLMNGTMGFIGKLATKQVPLLAASVVVMAAALSALAGERVHREITTSVLRKIYAALVSLIALTVWITVWRS